MTSAERDASAEAKRDASVTGRSVGIVGLGLIGGSLARDLAAAGWRVLADDHDAGTLATARTEGVVGGVLEPDTVSSLDLLVLAVPVRAAAERIRALGLRVDPASELVITDVGSTKRSAAAAAEGAGLGGRFVGSHPMAGSHHSGWSASRTGLFRGSTVWICPTSASRPEAVAAVETLWRSVGGEPRRMRPAAHDRLLARMSHLPQLTATALATVLARHGIDPDDLGPGGRDTTRLAASDPEVWTEITLDNSGELAPALDDLAHELAELARTIRTGDAEAVRSRLIAGREWSGGGSASSATPSGALPGSAAPSAGRNDLRGSEPAGR